MLEEALDGGIVLLELAAGGAEHPDPVGDLPMELAVGIGGQDWDHTHLGPNAPLFQKLADRGIEALKARPFQA